MHHVQVRHLNVHEHQAMDLLRQFNVNVARGFVANTPQEACAAAEKLAKQGVTDYVVKAQVLAGGRGKGHFSSGFKGGVHTVTSYVPTTPSRVMSLVPLCYPVTIASITPFTRSVCGATFFVLVLVFSGWVVDWVSQHKRSRGDCRQNDWL